jgi:CarD family transcriptional regulator
MATKRIFKVGDKVVYPGHGVGVISNSIAREIAGDKHEFFEIVLLEKEMKVMIPVSQADGIGLRRVMEKKGIAEVFRILKVREHCKRDMQTWNRRNREYSQKIRTGSAIEIAEVYRDLNVLKDDKELSFGEKQMCETAEKLIASEIAVSRSCSQEKVLDELRAIFAAA